MSDFDPDKYLEQEFNADQYLAANDKPETPKTLLKKSFEKLIQGSDYLGGLVRSGIAAGIKEATGKNLITEDEMKKAVEFGGFFPGVSELMERGGVLKENPKTRAVLGFAGDVLTDPFTYLGPGVITRPAGDLIERAGKFAYNSGLKYVDNAARLAKKEPVSDILWKNNIWGTSRGVANSAIDAAEELAKRRSELISAADMAGAKANMGRAMYPALRVVSEVHANPASRPMASELQDIAERFISEKYPSLRTATDWKSDIYDMVGSPNYQAFKQTNKGKEFQKEMARGLKDEVERAANAVTPGLGDKIADVNKEWGTLLSTAKTFDNEAVKGERKNFLTGADPYIMAIGALGYGAPGAGQWLLLKKAADASKTTLFRTGAGIGAKNLNRSKVVYPTLKRLVIDAGSPNSSPWVLIKKPDDEFDSNAFLDSQ
jgi:hypothetical protein